MVFSSLLFLFFFLPFALLVYYASPRNGKNVVLLAVSLFFYAWGEPIYILLMIFSAFVDYFHGLLIHKYRETKPIKAKMALISSLVINIGILAFFKYADFLVENINLLIGTEIEPLQLPLPIGISFYTFQTMSYSIDVYRGRVLPQRNPIALALYVSLFPQLIAGPIVRYQSIADELSNREWDTSQFADGVRIFIIGLGKKVLLANNIGLLWNTIQSRGFDEVTILAAWLGIIAFAFQIYFDFSGYSDMAVGLGKMFGFHFPRNFYYPYLSKSATEFWRRWHITLGSWFRDYVYIPLGGSKRGKINMYRNLLIVWGLTGLWHGASWNFAFWGLYFGIIIMIEKAGWLKVLTKMNPIFQHMYLIFVILISWVLFIFEDYQEGLTYLKIMFGFANHRLFDSQFLYDLYTNSVLLIILFIASTPVAVNLSAKRIKKIDAYVLPIFYLMILLLSTAYLVDESFNPFLYFRF
ncbi:MBOAT family O-acyltransferase [Ferdinandcohnia quinoae]|uniref:MBOAT family protein n=1 Tax=Fredinandcohnia quinoae TaxID=2918902 RepID=A0AAW5E7C0_9BACI|nr:MBOAT family O-acyltransferase [Fredinandcohnia sp. SECRCQ15]MCH1625917.1 MBOAT family protein [Fredinandcohnia sp. SECRCQ15]